VDVRSLPDELTDSADQPLVLGFRYTAPPRIPLRVVHHQEMPLLVTLVDEARATTLSTRSGTRLTSVRYRVRNNRRQFLRLELPEGAELWSTAVAGRGVQPAQSEDGAVLVPLVRSDETSGALADFEVAVAYLERTEDGDTLRAELPTLEVPLTWVGWTVWTPEQARVERRSIRGSLRPVEALASPFTDDDLVAVRVTPAAARSDIRAGAEAQHLGEGPEPVEVRIPLQGRPHHFERLLAFDEPLWVEFSLRSR